MINNSCSETINSIQSEESSVQSEDAVSVETLQAKIATLELEASQFKDKTLRLMAETENVRTRLEKEKQDLIKYLKVEGVKDFLFILDIVDNIKQYMPTEPLNDQLTTLVSGVDMLVKQIEQTFEKKQVLVLNPLMEKFNPLEHEAMMEVPTTEHPSGIILNVFQKGYKAEGKILRVAKVGVSKAVEPHQ